MLWPQVLLSDAQGLLIEFKSLFWLVASFAQTREPMQALSRFQVLRSLSLGSNGERARKVGDRVLIAQDLDPPLPNRTCSLSPHPALTESPTFRWIWVVSQIRKTQSIVLSAMGLLMALGTDRKLFSIESL